ncbi:hypothetical protein ABID70_000946 [Clavibacter michiganensis]|uniref:hypothetical protein n=1 Tax=Clavibacter michiganensis TaxID=28447 RepID=UPI001AE7F40A|nr:hypothetical protein [Clavibacter michiganensis]MBP2458387.1 hypothetical protein [Clavibacter michiganensis]MDQ0410958.1 hypothetical protein [Clavibacter michiganensis]
MHFEAGPPPRRRFIRRADIELIVALAWNEEGHRRGLRPLAWQIGDGDFVHFIGDADAYAAASRRDIIEDWIAELGVLDAVESSDRPLLRDGPDVVWTGSVGAVGMQFRYPAEPEEQGTA